MLRWCIAAIVAGLLLTPATATSTRHGDPALRRLLQQAQEQLETANDKDKSAYDAVACWCKSHTSEVEEALQLMDTRVTGLGHDMQAQKAVNARLHIELGSHEEDLASSSQSLSTAEALRSRDAAKFADDEQSHVQSIDQLKQALEALNRGAPASEAFSLLSRRAKSSPAFVQLQRRLRATNSPQVVTGVLKEMMSTFSRNLEDMRTSEQTAAQQHQDLVAAKGLEIQSLRKHLTQKRKQLADGELSVKYNTELSGRLKKLLDANKGVLAGMQAFCSRNENSFEVRQLGVQNQFVALSSAQAALAGAQLLHVASSVRDSAHSKARGDGTEAVCDAALELAGSAWRDRGQAACEKARAGAAQDAADATEALAADIRAAKEAASSQLRQCQEAVREAKDDASVAAKEASAEASFAGSEKTSADEQIKEVEEQAAAADSAKQKLVEVVTEQGHALQALHGALGRTATALGHMPTSSRPAEVEQAIEKSGPLAAAAATLGQQIGADLQHLSGSLDAVRIAAGKVLVTLRLMRADSEEEVVEAHEEGASRGTPAEPHCDSASLTSKVRRLEGYEQHLGAAAEALAYDVLR